LLLLHSTAVHDTHKSDLLLKSLTLCNHSLEKRRTQLTPVAFSVKEFNPSSSCTDFDISQCQQSCLVGFETDENGCILSCACKSQGLVEGDMMMTRKINVADIKQ